jgi:hypothetical protein
MITLPYVFVTTLFRVGTNGQINQIVTKHYPTWERILKMGKNLGFADVKIEEEGAGVRSLQTVKLAMERRNFHPGMHYSFSLAHDYFITIQVHEVE